MTPEEITAIIEDHKYPTLHAGDTGIHVSTLQIWLKMLGPYQGPITGFLDAATAQAVERFRAQQQAAGVALQAPTGAVLERDTWAAMDNLLRQHLPPDPSTLERLPFPRRSAYDSEDKYEKALYEGLKPFGFSTPPAPKRLQVRLMTNIDGVGELSGLPPGDYDLTIESLDSRPSGSAEVRLEDAEGRPVIGTVVLSGPDGTRSVTTQPDGTVALGGIEPGEYTLSLEDAMPRFQPATTGSTKIRVVDQHGKPVRANLLLSTDMGESAALQENVRLFKAMAFDLRSPTAHNGQTRFPNILSSELSETRVTQQVWNNPADTWGAFYGAPWIGIIIDPFDPDVATFDTCNWATRETIMILYNWGNHYLASSQDPAQLERRLQRPVAIRHLSHSRGQRVVDRSDFSQIGTACSLHRPRKTPRTIEGRVIDQFYGDVTYDSPDYDRDSLKQMTLSLIEVDSGFRARSPDTILVDQLTNLYPDINLNVRADRYALNRIINQTIEADPCTRSEPDIPLWRHYSSSTGPVPISQWKTISLNCENADHFTPGDVFDKKTFAVPPGIRPSIQLKRMPKDATSIALIDVENGYPLKDLVVSDGTFQAYRPLWYFRYYFERLDNDYPVQLYGFRIEAARPENEPPPAVKVLKIVKAGPRRLEDGDRFSPLRLKPRKSAGDNPGRQYPDSIWYDVTMPHVPGILVHFHDDKGRISSQEVFSSLTGQAMGYLSENRTITISKKPAKITESGMYYMTTVLPGDDRQYLTHVTGDIDGEITRNLTHADFPRDGKNKNLAYEVFVWDVLTWRDKTQQFTHSLDASSIMTTAVWEQIQNRLRPLAPPRTNIFSLRTRVPPKKLGTLVLPQGGPRTFRTRETTPPPPVANP